MHNEENRKNQRIDSIIEFSECCNRRYTKQEAEEIYDKTVTNCINWEDFENCLLELSLTKGQLLPTFEKIVDTISKIKQRNDVKFFSDISFFFVERSNFEKYLMINEFRKNFEEHFPGKKIIDYIKYWAYNSMGEFFSEKIIRYNIDLRLLEFAALEDLHDADYNPKKSIELGKFSFDKIMSKKNDIKIKEKNKFTLSK